MFTVKTIINGVTHICEQESVTIARADSERFEDILKQTNDHSNPDFAIWLPDVYSDPECKNVLQEEELIVSEREGVLDEDAIAILIEDFESPEHAKRKAFDGLRYQFIYPGDQVYVMNSHGSTIESVK
ncbi:MAG: hypothetical protein E6805_16735 [Citrobacter freundii]|uniref:hypothetical protein n=1 Tax=Citrobacter freundii TaxID=546 RepID=UPI000B53CA2E|nr:hypothetical protein [Citrobacter freundii]MDU7722553.1 hypothetical protein [Citrobacter sp.]ASG44793.1 hypothetical protein CES93_14670 [Citrobacter freundii]MDU1357142.1 hypothetical protein [Citrobacter freundii]MDU1698236.1 hypothetical protein [Citrobacter freundii]MDU1733278.1 hypothetical protein [Citrobacter freundii]